MTGASGLQGGIAPDAAAFDLGRLADALGEVGFGEYVADLDLHRPRRGDWERHRDDAPRDLQPLIDLFLLARGVDPEALDPRFGSLLRGLEDLGLAIRGDRDIAMAGGLVVVPVFGRWLMCHAPQPNTRFYFGDDTVALLTRLTPPAGGRCLDLCSGPGMLALHAAGIADEVVAVERTAVAAQLARMNLRLNRLEHRVRVYEGDLYAPVQGETFDFVVANPPMLPVPPGLDGGPIGLGGTDGFRLTRRILAGLPAALRPGGVAQIIGLSLSDGTTPLGIEHLTDAASGHFDLTVSILSHVSADAGTACFDALAATIAQISGTEITRVRRACRTHLQQSGATGLCHLFIHARHRRGEGPGRLAVIDVSSTNRERDWRWRGYAP